MSERRFERNRIFHLAQHWPTHPYTFGNKSENARKHPLPRSCASILGTKSAAMGRSETTEGDDASSGRERMESEVGKQLP